MEKYRRAGEATDGNIVRRLRIAYLKGKATDTDSEYVILVAFLREQWLPRTCPIITLYVYCLSCYLYVGISRFLYKEVYLGIFISRYICVYFYIGISRDFYI